MQSVLVVKDIDNKFLVANTHDRFKALDVLKLATGGDHYEQIMELYLLEEKDPWKYPTLGWGMFLAHFIKPGVCEIKEL